jgi:hypothetical protein
VLDQRGQLLLMQEEGRLCRMPTVTVSAPGARCPRTTERSGLSAPGSTPGQVSGTSPSGCTARASMCRASLLAFSCSPLGRDGQVRRTPPVRSAPLLRRRFPSLNLSASRNTPNHGATRVDPVRTVLGIPMLRGVHSSGSSSSSAMRSGRSPTVRSP